MMRLFKGIFNLIKLIFFSIIAVFIAISIIEVLQFKKSDNPVVKTAYSFIGPRFNSDEADKEEIDRLLDELEEDDEIESQFYKRCDYGIRLKTKSNREVCVEPEAFVHGLNYGRDIMMYLCERNTCADETYHKIKRMSLSILRDSLENNGNICLFNTRKDLINLEFYDDMRRERIPNTRKYKYTAIMMNGGEVPIPEAQYKAFRDRLKACNINL